MAQQRALPQSKEALLKSYQSKLKEDVKSMLENFEGKTVENYWRQIIQISLNVQTPLSLMSSNTE